MTRAGSNQEVLKDNDISAIKLDCFTKIKKRDGRIAGFDKNKITNAIFKAVQAVGGEDRELACELSDAITLYLKGKFGSKFPTIEEIQDVVEKVLIETGHAKTAKAYILHREKRSHARAKIKIRKEIKKGESTTDIALLVSPVTRDEFFTWDKNRITESLLKEIGLSLDIAEVIAQTVENKIFTSGLNKLSTGLIRELVDNELFERGFGQRLKTQSIIGMPAYDLEKLIFSKSKENSNVTSNNPEAINLAIAETTIKQYMLQSVFSDDVSNAHMQGMVHIHDLGYPRVYCSSHSLEYIKKYGLEMSNLDTASAPASHARTLTGHLNTFLASLQAYYAGALGIGYINIFYAPYLVGMSYEEMKQEAQYLIFSGSQNAFSRGGQTLFLDFNIHTGVPEYMKNVPAIGPKGEYTGKTYKEYEKEAQDFALAMLDVWNDGDKHGNVFAFPKCDFHVNDATFKEESQYNLFRRACEVSSHNGSTYFIFDRDEVTLSACCRLRTKITDNYMLEHPESMRFCGFQNVSINLPQASYRAGKDNFSGLLNEISDAMDIAMKAHLQKKKFIARLMEGPGLPMWEVGKIAKDGKPYVKLDDATYIVGIIGLNECVQHLTGKELHEDDETFKLGLSIIAHMKLKTNEYTKKYGLKVTLEESPAESAARRLAEIDKREYPESVSVMKGDINLNEHYYTNSIHFRADAPVDMVTRIQKQSKFHTLIESGAIIHAFVGEEAPTTEAIMSLMEKTFKNTQAAQVTVSPEFTMCRSCNKFDRGLKEKCSRCSGEDVFGITRIVGYFSQVHNWNIAKKGELKDRQKGNYSVV